MQYFFLRYLELKVVPRIVRVFLGTIIHNMRGLAVFSKYIYEHIHLQLATKYIFFNNFDRAYKAMEKQTIGKHSNKLLSHYLTAQNFDNRLAIVEFGANFQKR